MDLTLSWSPKRRHAIKINRRNKIFLRSQGVCESTGCENKVQINSEIHHIKPKQFGGTDDTKNLAILCKTCHDKISQEGQGILTWIEQHERLLLKNPNMDFFRKRNIQEKINYHKHNFLREFKFKNRDTQKRL